MDAACFNWIHMCWYMNWMRSRPSSRPVTAFARSVLLALALCLAACAERQREPSPEEAVQQLIDGMLRVHGDAERARAVYELLAKRDQDNLVERARRASAVAGRNVLPEEMITPSRFYLGFQPVRWSTNVSGNYALVTAYGQAPEQRSEIRCVKEADRWRVMLGLPELSPIERRDFADPAALR